MAKTKKAAPEEPKKARKSVDLTTDIWKLLKLQSIHKDFKNLKSYCESVLTDVSKQK